MPAGSAIAQRFAGSRARFRPFHFEPHETKNGDQVHGIVPIQLIELLEEYFANSGNFLMSGADTRTLFLKNNGRLFAKQ